MAFEITCCSTCDLTKSHLESLGVPCASYHYIIEGVDYPDDLFVNVTAQQFYDRIDGGAMPTTSQVTPEELIEMIEPLLQAGKDVLHIEFSSGLSGGFQSAIEAHKTLTAKYPERKFYIIDSRAASSGYGLLVEKAVALKNEGMGIDELYGWLESNKLRLRHWFFSTNLTHFKRGGRISGPAAAIGNMLNICPVMDVNSEGKLIIRKKVIGKKKAIRELVALMQEQAETDYTDKCFISNSMVREDAEKVAELVKQSFPKLDGDVEIDHIGPVIGSHTGTGTVALFYWSKTPRTL